MSAMDYSGPERRRGGPDRRNLGEIMPASQRIVVGEQPIDLAAQRRKIGEIHEADCTAAHFVFVGGPNSPFRGANAGRGIVRLAQGLELPMQRQDQDRVFSNAQTFRRHHDALLLELGNLVDQGLRIDHNAVADDRKLALSNDSGRQQRKFVSRAVDNQSVAGIMATLETDDDIGLFRQPVDNLTFAFVAPLGSDNHDIRHQISSLRQRPDT